MGSFTDNFWNLFIVSFTMGGMLLLFLFYQAVGSERGGPGDGKSIGLRWDEDLDETDYPIPFFINLMLIAALLFAAIYLILYPGLGSNEMLLSWTQTKQYEEEVERAERRYGPAHKRYLATGIEELAQDSGALRTARGLFLDNCAACHQRNATGRTSFPDLTDSARQYGGSPQQILQTIRAGRRGSMPPLLGVVGGEQAVNQLAQYVRSLNGLPAEAEAVAVGKSLFAQHCVACHGEDAGGNQDLGALDLTNGIWLYGSSLETIQHTISQGRQGHMPAFGERLEDFKTHLLAAYVYSLSARAK